jgi:rubredoxin/uncharacterized membrane protein
MKKLWRCEVCGYEHQGEEPPEFCPVCHADKSRFVLIVEESEVEVGVAPAKVGLLREMLDSLVPHAISAHFPNALIPVLVLFLVLFLLVGGESFETSAYSLLAVSVPMVALTFITGLYDWKTIYGGEPAPIFRKKRILAILLLVLGGGALIWRWSYPRLLLDGGAGAWLFLALIAAMLVCVTLLGHYGGMLVFAGRRQKE